MSMEDRMNNAQFTIRSKLCHVCKNLGTKEFDDDDPFDTTIFCRKFGDVPKDIYYGKIYQCKGFELDREEFFESSNFLPKDVVERLKQQL